MQELYLSIRESARELRISARTVSRYIDTGKIKAYRYSCRKILIPLSEIRAFQALSLENLKKDATNAALVDKCGTLN